MPTKVTPVKRKKASTKPKFRADVYQDDLEAILDNPNDEKCEIEMYKFHDGVDERIFSVYIAPLVGTCSCIELMSLPSKKVNLPTGEFKIALQTLMDKIYESYLNQYPKEVVVGNKIINFIMTLDENQYEFEEQVKATGLFAGVKSYRSLSSGKNCHLLVSTN